MLKFLAVAFGLIVSFPASPCTSFEFGTRGHGGLAHNFDWYNGMGYAAAFFVNARNVSKDGVNLFTKDPVAHWTSKYGSVTYSLVGREFPVGGQNEAGLVIHAQQAPSAQYPTGALPVVDSLQWMQYLLDTSATVSEAIQNAKAVRPAGSLALHYILCDANADCAVIEFYNGAMLTYAGTDLDVRALTNSTYPDSVTSWKACGPSGSCKNADNSLQRFIQGAGLSSTYVGQEPLQYAMNGLNAVAQSGHGVFTRYHFFNPAVASSVIYFSSGTQTQWQSLDMSKLDFTCAGAGKWFEVNLNGTGDQTANFVAYDVAEQQKLVAQVPAQPAWVPVIVNYPATTVCH